MRDWLSMTLADFRLSLVCRYPSRGGPGCAALCGFCREEIEQERTPVEELNQDAPAAVDSAE